MGLTYATLKAAKIVEAYKVQSFPTLIVIDLLFLAPEKRSARVFHPGFRF